MPEAKPKSAITIRDLNSFEDLQKAEALEREVWGLADLDVLPPTMVVATKEAGSIWVGAFDSAELVGFAFGFLGLECGQLILHSHMLAVRDSYRDLDLGYKLKLAQRERALGLRIHDARSRDARITEMTWTFDPLQSKNAHLNFSKLGVVSDKYKVNFYGPETSSVLHRNGTDRLWVTWPLESRRVRDRMQGKENRLELVDALSRLTPLIRFNGDGKPATSDLSSALARQRIAVEIPSDIGFIERKDPALAREWREATRWAFTEALQSGFFVADFCRTLRGKQGPGAYLLEKGTIEEYVPEMARNPV
jgi:predicted GNAT superfamily acetyltransferase